MRTEELSERSSGDLVEQFSRHQIAMPVFALVKAAMQRRRGESFERTIGVWPGD